MGRLASTRQRLSKNHASWSRDVRNILLFSIGLFLAIEIYCFSRITYISQFEESVKLSTLNFRQRGSLSNLFEGWRENILESAGRFPKEEQKVSFQLFDLRRIIRNVEPPPPFFYPIEGTLHSANYIMANERAVLQGWMEDLREFQTKNSSTTERVNCLDVGSNGGFFTLMSRSAGCRTLAVDAQPWCLNRLSSAATLNEFSTNLDVRWTAVGEDPANSIQVGATQCSGLWAVKDSEWINDESEANVNVSMTPLLDIVNDWISREEAIHLFKIDVEGSEMSVLNSAIPLFEKGRIGRVYVEIAPGRTIKITPRDKILETLDAIYSSGFIVSRITRKGDLDLESAKAWFADKRARHRNDPDMFLIHRPDSKKV